MTLSVELRKKVCKEYGIGPRQLRNKIKAETIQEKIADRNLALLLLAYKKGIDVYKPRYKVTEKKLKKLDEHLTTIRKLHSIPLTKPSELGQKMLKHREKEKIIPFIKYETDDRFRKAHVDEVNRAYTHQCYTSAFILCRKIIENLLTDIIRKKFPQDKKENIELYFDTAKGRTKDFSEILSNLRKKASDFGPDKKTLERLISLSEPFKDDANNKAHSWYHIVRNRSELDKKNIQDIIDIIVIIERNIH